MVEYFSSSKANKFVVLGFYQEGIEYSVSLSLFDFNEYLLFFSNVYSILVILSVVILPSFRTLFISSVSFFSTSSEMSLWEVCSIRVNRQPFGVSDEIIDRLRRRSEYCVCQRSCMIMVISDWLASRIWKLYLVMLRIILLNRFGVRLWLCLRASMRTHRWGCYAVSIELRCTFYSHAWLLN